jgi:integrase
LKAARLSADKLRASVAAGASPAVQRRRERVERNERSFAKLAELYVEYAKGRKKSWAEDARQLTHDVLPQWADRRYDQISRRDCIDLLDAMATRAPTGVNRVQSLLSAVFSYAIDEDLLQAHPCARLRRRTVEKPRTRVLSETEIRHFWSSIVRSPSSLKSGLALRLMLMTGMRTAEVAALNRSELVSLDDDQGAALLNGGHRIKNRRALLMPLVGLALATVREAAALSSCE